MGGAQSPGRLQKLAQSIRNHWEGILSYYPNRITSAAIESINGIIQTARRRARGFRNFENLKAICYWMAGDRNLKNPFCFYPPSLAKRQRKRIVYKE